MAGATAFLRGALDAGETALVAVVEPRATVVRQALGPDADRIEFLDMAAVGRNPARVIPAWQDWIDRNGSAGRGFRGISEPMWAARTPSEITECRLHESLLNTAFDGGPAWWLLCPHDVAALPASAIEHAHATHPWVVADGECGHGGDPVLSGATALAAEPLEEPPGPVVEQGFDLSNLGELRDLVTRFAEPATGKRTADDVALVVGELAANSIKYGGGGGVLRLWLEDAVLVCEVRDHGVITDPLAGRRRPSVATPGKAGLWIVNQACDLVQIRSASGRGTTVRARLARSDS